MPYEALAVNRVNRIMRELRDVRELPQRLRFLNRTPLTNATDGEITALYTGNLFAADIIPDGQRAVVRSAGSFTLETTKLPNVKHGAPITQEMLTLMDRINAGGGIRDDDGIITRYLQRTLDNLLTGVRTTMEVMRVGMALDSLVWNRLGVSFTATFGTPSDLKVTTTAWSDATNATPIADIQTMVALGTEKYGETYNRLTMTSVAFRLMIATTEFRNKAALYNQLVGVAANNFPITDMKTMTNLVGGILGMQIELYDAKYYTQNSAGTESSATNFVPDTKVILSSTSNDNDSGAGDIANAIVTESIVAELTGLNFAGSGDAGGARGFGGPQYGPVGYVTLATPDMNPPGINAWAVAKPFPRKIRKSAEAVLTIG